MMAYELIVKAKMKSSLKVNSPVYYRQLQIGSVESLKLSELMEQMYNYNFILMKNLNI